MYIIIVRSRQTLSGSVEKKGNQPYSERNPLHLVQSIIYLTLHVRHHILVKILLKMMFDKLENGLFTTV